MHSPLFRSALLLSAMMLATAPGLAADQKPATSAPVKAAKPVAAKLVDINSASKVELMKLPGVSEADAAKIVAGRPYLTKTRLVTKNIVSMEVYQSINKLVIAKQKETPAPKAPAK